MSSLAGIIDVKVALLPSWAILLIYVAILSLIVGIATWRRWLTLSGNVAAFMLGLFILYLGGFSSFFLLFFFFLAGSVLGKISKSFNDLEKKSGARDCFQVLANGLPALLGLFIFKFTPYNDAGLIAFSAAIAEALADTWSGDIGRLSRKDPVSIITFTRVPRGISGGVTALGFMGGLLASFLVSLLYLGTFNFSLWSFLIVLGFGFLGSIFDSVLGATIQVHYRDEEGRLTEKEYTNGKKNERVRGIPFIDNDAVNFLSGLFSMAFAFLFSSLIYHI